MAEAGGTPRGRGLKALYGFGSIGPGAIFAFQGFYLLFFFTDVALIPISVITIGLVFGRAWDVVNDPLVGWLSDRTSSRFGRRRVFVLAGALPLAATTMLLLWIPVGLDGWTAFAVLFGAYFLWDAALTVVHVPYYALGIETYDDYDARTSIVSYGAIGALVGYVLGGIGIPIVADSAVDLASGYRVVGVVLGTLAGLTVGLAGWLIKERPNTPTDQPTFRDSWRWLMNDRTYVRLMVALGAVRIGLTMASATLIFFVINHLGKSAESASLFIGVLLAAVIVTIPAWRWAATRWDKAPAYRAGLAIAAVGFGTVFLAGPEDTTVVLFAVAVIGVGSAAHWILPWAMIPDTVDAGHPELEVGVSFGVYGVMEKLTRSLALVAVSAILGLTSYEAGTDPGPGAVLAIRLMAGPIPAAFLLVGVCVLGRYPITRQRLEAIRRPVPPRSS